MSQLSLTLSEQQFHKRKTRKREFLERMERLVPWKELEAVIEPYYPRNKRGRPTIGLGRMLRMYFLQQWFNLSDEATEESLYDIPAFALFVGVDLSRERAPDATTLLRFRRLLETHRLTEALFERINRCLAKEKVCCSSRVRWWMPPSSRHPVPPRTGTGPEIRTCVPPRKATSGISG